MKMQAKAVKAWAVDMDIESYHAEKLHDSNSTLKLFRGSRAEYHEKRVLCRMEDKQSDPQRLGSLDHILIIEPQNFDKLAKIIPREVLSSNGAKSGKAWEAFEAEHPNLLLVKAAEFDKSAILADKVRSNPAIRKFLDAATIFEQSIFWDTGRDKLKCRIDIGIELDQILIDVKRTTNIDEFWRSIRDYDYHCQAALYSDGYEALYGVEPEFWFLLVGDNYCDCCIRRMPKDLIDYGRTINEKTLAELAECRAGIRPWMKDYFDQPRDLEIPPFLLPQEPVNTGARYEY